MRLLLDTHSFLWFIMGNEKLSQTARSLIQDPQNDRFLSQGSLWEMAIKINLGKLNLQQPFEHLIPHQLHINNISVLEIKFNHLVEVSRLPLHHRDPFDRLIISQSLIAGIPVVSTDSVFDDYGISRLW